jgi:hypothetical protein
MLFMSSSSRQKQGGGAKIKPTAVWVLNSGQRACSIAPMKLFLSLLLGALACLLPSLVRADEASHHAAAESLLTMMDMDKVMSQSVDQMLEIQVKQNPSIAPFQQQMKTFLNKYMSWASMKEDMVKLYEGEFTEPELKELVAFYQTPVGKKTIQKMPQLLSKGAEIGQKRIQEHLPELQAAIAASAAGSQAPAKKTP